MKPVIKWTGSKRSQASEILKYFPINIETYYEPFCGGCNMLSAVLESNIHADRYICNDLNSDLIHVYELIRNNPESLVDYYTDIYSKFVLLNNVDAKRDFYNDIRADFNITHNPYEFFWIMRVTVNGMPRYNDKGEFNNALHLTRNGMKPETLSKIIYQWNNVLNDNNVVFTNVDYRNVIPENTDDFVYLDPPYANTKGIYYGSIDTSELFEYISNLNCKSALSYDGIAGNEDNTVNVPTYDNHVYIRAGNSSFRRIIGKSKDTIVYESLYYN